jgi:hypothetical protein
VVDISLKSNKGKKGLEIDHSLKVDKDFGEDNLANETKGQFSKNIKKAPPKKHVFFMANICSHFCCKLKIIFSYGKATRSCFLVSRVTLSSRLRHV